MNQDTKTLTRIETNTSEQFADWRDELAHLKEKSDNTKETFEAMKTFSGLYLAGISGSALVIAICLSGAIGMNHHFAAGVGFIVGGIIMIGAVKGVRYLADRVVENFGVSHLKYELLAKNVAWLDKHGFSTLKKGA
jgi:hypothetical protein